MHQGKSHAFPIYIVVSLNSSILFRGAWIGAWGNTIVRQKGGRGINLPQSLVWMNLRTHPSYFSKFLCNSTFSIQKVKLGVLSADINHIHVIQVTIRGSRSRGPKIYFDKFKRCFICNTGLLERKFINLTKRTRDKRVKLSMCIHNT